jgi:hypothetical protein
LRDPVTKGCGSRTRGGASLLALGLALASSACGEQVFANNGLAALMQVNGGQFYPGKPPVPLDGGITVATLELNTSAFFPGQINFGFGGQLSEGAYAVSLYFVGDTGYWTLPASNPDYSVPRQVDFGTSLTLSRAIGQIAYGDGGPAIQVQAIDGDGGFGPPLTEPLHLLSNKPIGPLVISLGWDTQADLDLHVVLPDGTEIWRQHQSDYVSGEVKPPPANLNAYIKIHNAYLDFDSNAQCVIDGRRIENVVWGPDAGIQSGTYTVRVDTFSMCNQVVANWQAGAFVDGGQIAGATGQSSKNDEAYFQHGAGAGLTAFTFTVP